MFKRQYHRLHKTSYFCTALPSKCKARKLVRMQNFLPKIYAAVYRSNNKLVLTHTYYRPVCILVDSKDFSFLQDLILANDFIWLTILCLIV